MRSVSIILFLISISLNILAQNYQISFTASGNSSSIDSIQIENLFQGTTLSINGNDILQLVGTVGINSPTLNSKLIKAYPNPTNETSIIEFNNEDGGLLQIDIYSIEGKLLKSLSQNSQKGYQKFSVSGLSSGSYIVRISNEIHSSTISLVSLNKNKTELNISYLGESIDIAPTTNQDNNDKSTIQMQYNDGDRILFKAYSGTDIRLVAKSLSQNQTIDFNFVSCTDADGNNYAVTTIDTQTWMAENLKTSKYNDGTSIPTETDNINWAQLTSPAYCWFDNDQAAFGNVYGALYNWYTIDSASNGNKNVCPVGWHPSTEAEWDDLAMWNVGYLSAGGYLKEKDTLHWLAPNTNATNFDGFTGLPGGYRSYGNGAFGDIRFNGQFWSSTEFSQASAHRFVLNSTSAELSTGATYKETGQSVRCIKD